MSILNKFHYNSPVILSYTLLSLAVLLLGVATDDKSTMFMFCIYKSSFTDPMLYVRLLGHVVGHAGFDHFFSNFVIILLIGPILEEKYGSIILLVMMIATALITGLLNITFFDTGLLGASGIVFMLIILGSFVNLQKGRIPLTFILIVIIFLGKEIVQGLNGIDNISRITHVAGGICGAILGFLIHYVKEDKPKIPTRREKGIEEEFEE